MPHIPLGYGEFVYRFSCTGIPDVITTAMGFFNQDDLSVAACAILGNAAYESNDMALVGNMGVQWTYLGCEATIRVPSGLVSFFEAENRAGSASTQRPPANCAVIVQKLSALGGRSNRGRMFHPITFLETTAVEESGFMNSGSVATVQGWFDAFLTDLETGVVLPRILHTDPAATPTTINQLVVSPQIGTQRRRIR